MEKSFFKTVSVIGLSLNALAAAIFAGAGQPAGAAGVLVSAVWMWANTWFLCQLVNMGMHPEANPQKKVPLLLILKFPVLYLAGYFILKSGRFSVAGILTGLTLFFGAFLVAWFSSSRAKIQKGVS